MQKIADLASTCTKTKVVIETLTYFLSKNEQSVQ